MRTHLCAHLRREHIGAQVSVTGWVSTRRDHGGVIFIDLRDRSGVVQIVAAPETKDAFAHASDARNEFALRVHGEVRARPEGTANPDLPGGDIEIAASAIEILSACAPLPFQLDDTEISEAVRLKYRFLDLRRAPMQHALRLRHRLIKEIRAFLDARDFVEIETPILTRSTPEGARDYLVPSRVRAGAFFALPQSPQLFKQLLMAGGFERYYQIAKCFRDEDLRADRQPEFTQLDVEMSFVDEDDVTALMEELTREVFARAAEVTLPQKFPRMRHAEAMSRYGSDRPDLRIGMQLTELTEVMRGVEFKVFSAPANDAAGRVAALRVPGGGALTRAQIDHYTEFVGAFGAKGLAYIKVESAARGRDGLRSPILKFLPDDALGEIMQRTEARDGDVIFFGADKADTVNAALGALRVQLAQDLQLVESGWKPVWVVDFPLLHWDTESKRWQAQHHPFTSPRAADIELLQSDPGKVLARAYDLVINGVEIGGGSIRIHERNLQQLAFDALGIDAAQAESEFGFLLDALQYGAPPHGGIAFGIDRIAAMLCARDSIRDVIAFPKTQKAACLLTGAPGEISAAQLRELGLRRRGGDAV